ncbi:sugar ABC transporter permease [Gorillibacterium massiliense]|uniref:sugar ABC transporter permease n=1 Tax=Gorillibacterium massiliense TaxID=1280390 RepID=UPI0004BCBDAE|nr:sugar ABC transporter permease [Gorillibacterium massiliense]
MRQRKKKGILRLTLSYITLVIISICCLYPALWVVFGTFRPGRSLYSKSFIPKKFTLVHYKELFHSDTFLFAHWYMNTFKIAFFTMLLGTSLILLTSYALSRFRFRWRKQALSTLLILGMFPGFMSMIAIFLLLKELNMLDTHIALILVYSAGAPLAGTFVAKGFFDTIPRSLDEAARIDGASNWHVFTRIILPLSRPMLTYIALLQFVGPWVDYIFARLILRTKEQWTLAVGLWDLLDSRQNSDFAMFATATVLIAVPITILFMLLQRLLVEGLTSGASKG